MDSVEFTIIDATGRVLRTGSCPEDDRPLQAVEPGEVVLPEAAPPGTWHDGTGFAARPSLGLPSARSLAVDEEWVTGAPAGTAITVDGVPAGTLDADEPVAFDTSGDYRVEFAPPFPWLDAACLVTVA